MDSPASGSENVWGDIRAEIPTVTKKKRRLQKKAPGAPKRGKSPYILFSMDKREEIKSTMAPNAKVTDVMRAIADAWSKMSEDEKAPWKTAAESDKQRYEEEMATYDGPLRVPNKRAKKHPNAPKRASSAFLFYSQVMRPRIKSEHQEMKNTEISKQLGEAWGKATKAQKAPFVEKELVDRARYKREMEEWNNAKPERDYQEAHQQQYNAQYGFDQLGTYDEAYATTDEIQSMTERDFLAKTNVELAFVRPAVTPPVNCPSWVCCLLPCIMRTEGMRLYTNHSPKEVNVMRTGDTVAADCRLLECSEDFTVDLSALANEKLPRVCSVECTDKENGVLSRNMVFMASAVVKGDAIGVVVATGDNTVWGQLISNHKWPLVTDVSNAESERFIGNKA
ncbi:hypothetical protein DYB36_000818 [Aphanomyces astaci]|uniref:HMG box domain-containing protein n=1 Tax=Aphanomyces astaci TaxID=112090 RepID=A0A397A6K3_APHAT|nr:hypothetical protein DYB36_000818 [Aphanomyces astaci]